MIQIHLSNSHLISCTTLPPLVSISLPTWRPRIKRPKLMCAADLLFARKASLWEEFSLCGHWIFCRPRHIRGHLAEKVCFVTSFLFSAPNTFVKVDLSSLSLYSVSTVVLVISLRKIQPTWLGLVSKFSQIWLFRPNLSWIWESKAPFLAGTFAMRR